MSVSLETLLRLGAEAMAHKEYANAVELYSEACQVSNLDTSKDDPDLMFLYAKALFANGVATNDVFGSKAGEGSGVGAEEGARSGKTVEDGCGGENLEQEVEEESSGFQFNDSVAIEEEDEGEEEGDEDEKENEESKKLKEESKKLKEESNKGTKETVKEEASMDCRDAPTGDDETGEGGEEDSGEEVEGSNGQDQGKEVAQGGEEEVSDFEIAWDILELTRVLYEKRMEELNGRAEGDETVAEEKKKVQERLADVHLLMGDIGLETENFTQAVEDFGNAVKVIMETHGPKGGMYREAQFKLSLAYEFVGDEESIEGAVDAIEKVLQALDRESCVDIELRKDVEERMKELREMQAQRREEKAMLKQVLFGVTTSGHGGGDECNGRDGKRIAANDLTGLVKRKRKEKKNA
ncbi:NASP-related protein sim3 [Pichia kudriavzevii]|uniref:NASP-related protein sim3 n=1 Tax=Pichia kudriavzevii TaxID=4909 RepID=A0A1V2LJH1_PICKU|nr:NASP-related protein sim3 [Pichia kudriavzevii]